ncbi:hypothetical protein D3C87_1688200 [compost metagenome]
MRLGRRARQPEPRHGPAGTDQQQEQNGLDEPHATRHAVELQQQQRGEEQRTVEGHRLGGARQRGHPRITENRPIQAKPDEDREGQHRR